MIRGIYTAASGMLSEMDKQDIISNNLANVNSSGFKADKASFYEFPKMFVDMINGGSSSIGLLGRGSGLYGVFTDYTEGQMKETGNPLDLAITGNGFFAVNTPNGVAYTRDGSFTLDGAGRIVTKKGYLVLDTNGAPITVGRGGKISVSDAGTVSVDNRQVGRVAIYSFGNNPRTTIRKVGDNLFVSGVAPTAAANARVKSGYLENSNVNPIKEMVEMITTMRAFETNQRIIQAQDETLDRAVNTVGRI